MNKLFDTTTRRKFLKAITSSITATTIGITGWSYIIGSSKEFGSDLKVFSEGKIGSLSIKNRLVRAAALERASFNGSPTDIYLKMYESYTAGGAGLIITGAMAPISPGMTTQIHVFDDRHIPELEKIVKVVKSVDDTCKIMAQVVVFGGGFGPSDINWTGTGPLKILTVEQINGIVCSLAESIRRIKEAGFDGAEVNAHYTYLLSSFLSPHTNKRTDEYGGSVENRVRIVREVVEQARPKVGRGFPIIIKLNCDDSLEGTIIEDGTNINNFHMLAGEIERAGFDGIELSGNTLLRKDINSVDKESFYSGYADNLDIKIPVILTGGNRSPDNVEEILRKGKIDFFGFARPFIREPDLPKRWLEEGSTVKSKCISCNSCLTDKTPLHCLQQKT